MSRRILNNTKLTTTFKYASDWIYYSYNEQRSEKLYTITLNKRNIIIYYTSVSNEWFISI